MHPADWWEANGVELLTRTSVLDLDTAARTAKLSTKEEVGFDRALIATGAMVRRLPRRRRPARGHPLPARARQRRRASAPTSEGAERVVCVGGSYIASEVAASLTELGKQVTMVMLEDHPLERRLRRHRRALLPRACSRSTASRSSAATRSPRFEGERARASACVTAGGRELEAQAVICGVGAMPDVMLARKSGLTLGELGGVLCDSRLRTSADGIYAAGDMCEYDSVVHGRVVRIEHEEVAAAQGATAARNMLGADAPHDEVPYFFSDLSDWASLEYLGPALQLGRRAGRGLGRRRRVRDLVPRGRPRAGDAERRRRRRPRPRARAHQGLAEPLASPRGRLDRRPVTIYRDRYQIPSDIRR